MNDSRSPTEILDDFLNDLAENVRVLSDKELRAELREDGESLDEYSARFQTALRAAESRLQPRPSRAADLPISSELIADGVRIRSDGIEEIADFHGKTKWGPHVVHRYAGRVNALMDLLPEFETAPFRAHAEMEEHPDLRLVVRKESGDRPEMAVGAVSRQYSLVQHRDAVEMCLRGLRAAALDPGELRGELALSHLGEWMGFTFVLPGDYTFQDTYGHQLDFRCDVSNSVDGSSRLSVWFDWFRQVCSNGLVVREERHESSMHRRGLQLNALETRVFEGFRTAVNDRETLKEWQDTATSWWCLKAWVDDDLRKVWRDHAAARVCHICLVGEDTRFAQGANGRPSVLAEAQVENPAPKTERVPGSPHRATTKYDVAQAMSWVASRKTNIVERVRWQAQIPELLDRLQAA